MPCLPVLLGWQCYLLAACCQLLCATDRLFSALLHLLPVVCRPWVRARVEGGKQGGKSK